MTRVVIAGAGVAGSSVAYFLARRGIDSIAVVERETRPAYHASGRSAAALVELETDLVVQRLLAEAAGFLRDPPSGFPRPLLSPTGVLYLLGEQEHADVQRVMPTLAERGTVVELLDVAGARRVVPQLTVDDFAAAAWMPNCGRIDVDGLIGGYLRGARDAGARVLTDTAITGVQLDGDRVCAVDTTAGPIECDRLVIAAGAWASELGQMARAMPVPLVPRRRTIVTFDPPGAPDVSQLPLCAYDSRLFYFAPEGRGLLASPMDEHEMEPCDAKPDDAVVADTLERMRELAGGLASPHPTGARAGLRTFAPDKRPVLGPDPHRPGVFWLAGQGGWGIETSPALGRIAADWLVDGESSWPDAAALSVTRFA